MSKENNYKNTALSKQIRDLLRSIPTKCHFRVHTAFSVRVDPEWGIAQRTNNDLHLLFVSSGRGSYKLEEREEPLKKGKVIFVGSGFSHSSEQDPNDPPVITPIRFGLHENQTGKQFLPPQKPFAFGLNSKNIQKYSDLFRRVTRTHTSGVRSWRIGMCNALLYQIMAELLLDLQKTSNLRDKRIEDVRAHIAAHPEKRYSLENLADMAHLSPKYFSQLFRKQVGISPGAYSIRSRCQFAQHLLEDTTLNVQEIALNLNYPDQYSFSKQFKQIVGLSPNNYRTGRNNLV